MSVAAQPQGEDGREQARAFHRGIVLRLHTPFVPPFRNS